jgi:hypothetical protein
MSRLNKHEFTYESRCGTLEYRAGDEAFDLIYVHCNYGITQKQILWYRRNNPNACIIGGVRGWMGFLQTRDTLKLYDGIHTNNLILLAAIRELVGDAVYLCHAGVDTSFFNPMSAQTIATEQPQHKLGTLIIGWAGDTAKQVKNAHCISALGFPYALATKPGQGHHYVYDQMPAFYNALDVLVFPSFHPNWPTAEGCPLPILEAGACGKPILATKTAGAAPEFLDDFQIIHRPLDQGGIDEIQFKLQYLEKKPSFRKLLGIRNRRVAVQQWDWKDKIAQYEILFNAMAS